MIFCPKCGSMMHPKEEKGKKFFACSCGYNEKKAGTASAPKVIKEVVTEKKDDSASIMSEHDTTLPTTEEVCPKCGHGIEAANLGGNGGEDS